MYDKCVNNVTKSMLSVTTGKVNWFTFVMNILKSFYAHNHCFNCFGSRRCIALAGEYLYTYGPQDQKYPECRCGDPGCNRVIKGFWITG